jgi:vitamin B12 transporter
VSIHQNVTVRKHGKAVNKTCEPGYRPQSKGSGDGAGGTSTVHQPPLSSCSVFARLIPDFVMFQRGRLEFTQETQMKHPQLIAAILCAVSPFAHAETSNQIDEVVVTATRIPQSLGKTIADTSVITEQEIRHSGAPDVATLLRSVTGIEIAQSGGLGAQSSTFMRGTNSSHVLVLIDGVRINSATSGATALEHIMLDSIERIEIVRGNVSSLYGSEAIGGVIQLFTKKGSGKPAFTASAGVGSYGTQRMAAGFSGEVEKTSFSMNAGRVKTDGVSAINPQLASNVNPNNNGYDNNTFNAQIKHTINADHAVSATWFSTRSNLSSDTSGDFVSSADLNNSQQKIDKVSLTTDDQISEIWHSQVRLAQGVDDIQSYGTYPSSNLKIAEGQRLNLSAENLGQTVSSDTNFTQTTRNVNSVLAGYSGEYGAQQVQLNVRQDNYSDFGTSNTGLLGYGLALNEVWRATGSISTAFKAPTFNNLFAPASWGGNPNLKPERSQNQEVGLHYTSAIHRVDIVYFDNRITDLIVSQSGTMANIDAAQITGQELSYVGDFGNKHLKASVTLQNPRDTTTGLVLQRRAKQLANVSASHDLGTLNMGIEVRYSGERQDTNYDSSTPVTLPSYSLVNLTTRYTIDSHFSVSARIDNVFDREYSEVYSYNTLGRSAFISLMYQ